MSILSISPDSLCLIINKLSIQDYIRLLSTCKKLNNLKSNRDFLEVLVSLYVRYMKRGLFLLNNEEIFEIYNYIRKFHSKFGLYRKLKELGYYDYVKEIYTNRDFKGKRKIYNILSCSYILDDFQVYRDYLLENLDIDLTKGSFMSLITISFKYDISLFINYVEHNNIDVLNVIQSRCGIINIIRNCSTITFDKFLNYFKFSLDNFSENLLNISISRNFDLVRHLIEVYGAQVDNDSFKSLFDVEYECFEYMVNRFDFNVNQFHRILRCTKNIEIAGYILDNQDFDINDIFTYWRSRRLRDNDKTFFNFLLSRGLENHLDRKVIVLDLIRDGKIEDIKHYFEIETIGNQFMRQYIRESLNYNRYEIFTYLCEINFLKSSYIFCVDSFIYSKGISNLIKYLSYLYEKYEVDVNNIHLNKVNELRDQHPEEYQFLIEHGLEASIL